MLGHREGESHLLHGSGPGPRSTLLGKRSLEHSGRHEYFPSEETKALSERCPWLQEKRRPGVRRREAEGLRRELVFTGCLLCARLTTVM